MREQRSRGDGDAQGHMVAVGDKDVGRAARRIADPAQGEALSEQRMGRVGHLDLGDRIIWVIERGSEVWGRST